MIKTLQTFETQRVEILNEKGDADKKLLPKLSEKQILDMYKWMSITRAFDTKAVNLQRTGRLGTYASMLGQEAAIIGSAYALRKQDWIFPSFRYSGGMLLRGIPMDKLYSYWGGDERGAKPPENVNVFPLCITVGEQPLHATGFAWGLKLKKENAVVLTDFGDGATSTGDLYEALNYAGVFQTPVIFLCQNNQYAISIPVSKQTNSATLAQKAIAAGIRGIQVDGNDIFAVYKVTQDAMTDALKGKPTFIEALTYRISDHTTSDDSTKYRQEKEVQAWKKRDPLHRLKLYMEKKKVWNAQKEEALKKEIDLLVDQAVKSYEAIPRPPREDIFKYTIAGGVT